MLLSAEEFSDFMKVFALPPDGRVALAVSGGPDSMALAFLVQHWCAGKNFPAPVAFIVDHALRPESAAEAAGVKKRLESLGISAEILIWDHPPVTRKLHNEARKARYKLLLQACQKHKISCLLLGHQREDQAETILMRFAKGTGTDGLAGIPAETVMAGVRICRPLLPVMKERLVATCAAAGISFVTDPSNNLEKFARGRLRRVMPLLAEEGLTVERLVDCGLRAGEAREALEFYTHEFLKNHSHQNEWGVIAIEKEKLYAVPRAIALRALSLALQAVHAEDYAPPHASLSLLLDALQDDGMPPRTLNGCLVGCRLHHVVIAREISGITDVVGLRSGQTAVWDGRWQVAIVPDADAKIYEIRALGNASHDVLDRLAPDLRHKVPQGRVRAALPALWSGPELAMIPFLDKQGRSEAKLLSKWPPAGQN